MKKIISLFQRNYDGNRLVRNEVVPGAEWVTAGEGMATRKWDGTCCLVRDGHLYKRYELKRGKKAPEGFEPAQEPDPVTGDVPGWVPVSNTAPEDCWHREAFDRLVAEGSGWDGTYELIGPKIQGNPEHSERHELIPHGAPASILAGVPRDFDGLRAFFATRDIEGIVWHHPDGRMVKIKAKDFGIRRGGAA